MKEIPLTKGKVALVDDEDYEWLKQSKWYAQSSRSNFYACRKSKNQLSTQTKERMHRLIMSAPDNMEVDHINRNSLDNQRKNLRICTRSQNAMNTPKSIINTSGYKGVIWFSRDNKWRAEIRVFGKNKHLGLYENIIDAAHAYDEAAKKYRGEFAVLNFPNS